MTDQVSFDDLDRNDYEYDFDDYDTVDIKEPGDEIAGKLEATVEDVGKYDSTVFLFEHGEMCWANATMVGRFDASDAEVGDYVAFKQTDETYENDFGEFNVTEFAYRPADAVEDDE